MTALDLCTMEDWRIVGLEECLKIEDCRFSEFPNPPIVHLQSGNNPPIYQSANRQ
jgi:hypothetical protein